MHPYPSGCGKHVLVPKLEAVHLLQDNTAVLLILEEVCAAEDAGVSLGLVALDKHCGGVVVWFYTPMGIERHTYLEIFVWTYLETSSMWWTSDSPLSFFF